MPQASIEERSEASETGANGWSQRVGGLIEIPGLLRQFGAAPAQGGHLAPAGYPLKARDHGDEREDSHDQNRDQDTRRPQIDRLWKQPHRRAGNSPCGRKASTTVMNR